MKQPIEETKKPLWLEEKPEKKIVIKISDIRNSMKRKKYLPSNFRKRNKDLK